jgi:hypothetical protein
MYLWYIWQGHHQIYGHLRCVYVYGSGQPYVYLEEKEPGTQAFLHRKRIYEEHEVF